jgi:predicted acyl esterase
VSIRGSRTRIALATMGGLLGLSFTAATADAAKQAPFSAHGSAKQVYATGLKPNAKVSLVRNGKKVDSKRAGSLGGVLFRDVKPGSGYRVKAGKDKSGQLTVFTNRPAPPSEKVYDQKVPTDGYGYMKMRDGTKLAYSVHPPEDVTTVIPGASVPPLPSNGKRPTLIEYSGYGYARPSGPVSGISIIANLMGFTVVDIQMRGTGCSAGAFDFFEPLQSLDGYDIIETVAHQDWVAHHQVGMMGISYGGISQLFTAQMRPPSLVAISPLSVIDQVQTTLYPGGILNTGFALNWAKERAYEARPAGPNGGQEYAYERIKDGDQVCKENQTLHTEAANLLKKVKRNDHYKPKVADPLSPITFVDKIDVPVFMACQWTDEQTGGHCPTLAEHMTGTDKKWFTYTNGTHVDSLDPETFNRWYDFLEIYVARQAPAQNAAVMQAAAPVIYQEAMGIPGVTLPPDPIQAQPTYDLAKAAFEDLDSVRVLFDNGAGGSDPGEPYPGYEQSFAKFPVPGTTGRSWFLGDDGALTDRPPARKESTSFKADPDARPPTDFTGDTAAGTGGLWTATPPYKWTQNPKGTAASFLTAPLKADTTVVGAGYVRAWVKSSKPLVDLQVTLSEVRPDDKETFVQGGWLALAGRKLDKKKSKPLEPVLSLRKEDIKPMPKGKFVPVTIPLYYEGHSYRADSQIRITISAPNGDQPIWSFAKADPKGKAKISILSSKKKPSKLTLPVIGNVDVPTGLPPCPGLRGEPCRDYKPYENR